MDKQDQKYYLKLAYTHAMKSPDPSTQNGALILTNEKTRDNMGIGVNTFPFGVNVNVPERWERPLKYQYVIHAEESAICDCAKQGLSTRDATMVCGWAACSSCAKSIIQSGIKKLITHKQAHDRSPEFWKKEIEIAMIMFQEAGVEVEFYDGDLEFDGVITHCGEAWVP